MKTKNLLTVLSIFAMVLAFTVSSVPLDARKLIQELPFKAEEDPYNEVNYDWEYTDQVSDYLSYTSWVRIGGLPFDIYYDGELIEYIYQSGSGQIVLVPDGEDFNDYLPYSWRDRIYPYYPHLTNRTMSISAFCGMIYGYYYSGSWPYDFRGKMGFKVENDRLIFQWSEYWLYYYYYYGGEDANLNFQIILYEDSDVIEMRYGTMERGDFEIGRWNSYTYRYKIGLVGYIDGNPVNSMENYVNVVPPNHPDNDEGDWLALYSEVDDTAPIYDNKTIINNDVFESFQTNNGLLITFGVSEPQVVGVTPGDDAILELGEVYGEPYHPAVDIFRTAEQPEVELEYKIAGPLPRDGIDYRDIYTAIENGDIYDTKVYLDPQPVNPEEDVPYNHEIESAMGIAAQANPNDGSLDLTDDEVLVGGEYEVISQVSIVGTEPEEYFHDRFIIALDYDLAINNVISPKKAADHTYPFEAYNVPIRFYVSNVGLNPSYEFAYTATVKDANGETLYNQTRIWEADPDPLRSGESVRLTNLPNFVPSTIGDYTIEMCVENLNPARDDAEANDCMPRSYDEDRVFHVMYNIEASAIEIINPTTNIFLRKPIKPRARFQNNGISGISDAPSYCTIEYLEDGTPEEVYTSTFIIPDIPEGRMNKAVATYEEFRPLRPGLYRICAEVDLRDDPIYENNFVCDSFYVVEAMSGVYTIGFENTGDDRNFETFQQAADALYQIGVSGPVIFELTDSFYNISSIGSGPEVPALDLSARIVGVDEDNTITFRPSAEKRIQSESIELMLQSPSGIGFKFGQNPYPNNSFADVHSVGFSSVNYYSNSEGYITIDGGPYKAIKVTMETVSEFRAPFFLQQGSRNITIKNIVIENDDIQSASSVSLPLMFLNPINLRFEYQDNVRGITETLTYSAGVVMRSEVPIDEEFNANIYNLDTIPSHDIRIENNEISGFGYGVVTLGMGILYKSGEGFNKYMFFPGKNNVIHKNVIHDVARAGIFVGFEDGIRVTNNRIFNVNGNFDVPSTKGVAGIIAGGDSYEQYYSYFNTNTVIMNNEISGVTGSGAVHGIKVENPQLEFPGGLGEFIFFPDQDENSQIANNMIWGLNGVGEDVFRAGIHVLTQRDDPQDLMGTLLTPQIPSYYSRNDKIINNTIMLSADAESEMNAGVAIQQAKGTEIYNNAIVVDGSNDNPDAINAALFFQTKMPKTAEIKSDRNAYWLPDENNSCIAYFVELDEFDNSIIEISDVTDYQNLNQWYNWTGMDINSVYGDFESEYTFMGYPPKQKLRVKTNPAPQNSILNNRGMNVDWVETDIDGDIRGTAAQRYDIGADEFTGRMHVRDIEITKITEPSEYKRGSGPLSDAEYVMIGHPLVEKFNVKAIVRNNGSLNQSQVKVYTKVYRMEPDGVWGSAPVIEDMVEVDLNTSESKEIDFNLSENPDIDDALQTYSDLVDYDYPVPYSVPDKFSEMWHNVTPLHKVVIEVEPDEENSQNSLSKVCRFYLMRAPMRIMVSAVNTWQQLDQDSPVDVVAGQLNFRSVVNGMMDLAWFVDYDRGRTDYDIFDRTTWEPKAIDYTPYRTLIWSDGDAEEGTSGLTRYQRMDISEFLNNSPIEGEKKNMIISSQEMLRNSDDERFNSNVLRAENANPGNPMGLGVSNDGNKAIGNDIDKDFVQTILATGYQNDVEPYCGVMIEDTEGAGIVKEAFNWQNHPATGSDIVGVTVNTFTRNLMFYAVDWRHWSNPERILRGSFDFVEKNDGFVIPVELYTFDARQVGNKVHVNWATASEVETDRFEIERALRTDAGTTDFVKIAEEPAVGNSNDMTQYGPVIDRNVNFGTTYVYRLKMIDLNGEFDYSQEREVNIGGSGELWLGMAQPNPAANDVRFEISGIDGDVQIACYDVDGKVVSVDNTISGNILELDISSLSSGTYTLVVINNGNNLTRQFQVVK